MNRGAYHCRAETFEVDRAVIVHYAPKLSAQARELVLGRLVRRQTFDAIGARLGVTAKEATLRFRNAVKELIRLVDWDNPGLVKRRCRPRRKGELC